jgi:hypothetical protein
MKNQAMIVLAITLAGLAAGCKRPDPGVDDPPARNTNTASAFPLPPAGAGQAAFQLNRQQLRDERVGLDQKTGKSFTDAWRALNAG